MLNLLLILLPVLPGASALDYSITVDNRTRLPLDAIAMACVGERVGGPLFNIIPKINPSMQFTQSWSGDWNGCVTVRINVRDCLGASEFPRALRQVWITPTQRSHRIVVTNADFPVSQDLMDQCIETGQPRDPGQLTLVNRTRVEVRATVTPCESLHVFEQVDLEARVRPGQNPMGALDARSVTFGDWSGCVEVEIQALECSGLQVSRRQTWILPNQRSRTVVIEESDLGSRSRISDCVDETEEVVVAPPPPPPSEPQRCPSRPPGRPYFETHSPGSPRVQWVDYPPLEVACGYQVNGNPIQWMLKPHGSGYQLLRWRGSELIPAMLLERGDPSRLPAGWTEGGGVYGLNPNGAKSRPGAINSWTGRAPEN